MSWEEEIKLIFLFQGTLSDCSKIIKREIQRALYLSLNSDCRRGHRSTEITD